MLSNSDKLSLNINNEIQNWWLLMNVCQLMFCFNNPDLIIVRIKKKLYEKQIVFFPTLFMLIYTWIYTNKYIC